MKRAAPTTITTIPNNRAGGGQCHRLPPEHLLRHVGATGHGDDECDRARHGADSHRTI